MDQSINRTINRQKDQMQTKTLNQSIKWRLVSLMYDKDGSNFFGDEYFAYLSLGLTLECKIIFRLAVGNFITPKPVNSLLHKSRHVLLNVGNIWKGKLDIWKRHFTTMIQYSRLSQKCTQRELCFQAAFFTRIGLWTRFTTPFCGKQIPSIPCTPSIPCMPSIQSIPFCGEKISSQSGVV